MRMCLSPLDATGECRFPKPSGERRQGDRQGAAACLQGGVTERRPWQGSQWPIVDPADSEARCRPSASNSASTPIFRSATSRRPSGSMHAPAVGGISRGLHRPSGLAAVRRRGGGGPTQAAALARRRWTALGFGPTTRACAGSDSRGSRTTPKPQARTTPNGDGGQSEPLVPGQDFRRRRGRQPPRPGRWTWIGRRDRRRTPRTTAANVPGFRRK